MKILVCLGLAAIFAAPAEAQLFRRRYICPPVQKEIITISPPPAPTTPEVPYYPIQAIPQPVPVPMPGGGGKTGVDLGDLALGLNLHWHNLMGQHQQPQIQPVQGGGDDSLLKLALIMKMLNGDTIKEKICENNGEGDDTESIKMMMLMKMMADHRAEDADDSNDQNGDSATINALIQALMTNRQQNCPQPAPPVQIQPVPTPAPVQIQPQSLLVPQTGANVSCSDLLRMLMGNK